MNYCESVEQLKVKIIMRKNVVNRLWKRGRNVKRKMGNKLWRVVRGVRKRNSLTDENRNLLRSMGYEVLV